MPLLIRNKSDRIALQFGSSSALRASNEVIEQLQEQIRQLQDQLQAERE